MHIPLYNITYYEFLSKMTNKEIHPLALKFKRACDSRDLHKMRLSCHYMFNETLERDKFTTTDLAKAFEYGIQSILRTHDHANLYVQIHKHAESIFESSNDLHHMFDLNDCFCYCWQNGYTENCNAMIELSKTTSYYVSL